MRWILRVLGLLCIMAAVGFETLPFMRVRSSYLWTDSLVMLGVLFFYLAGALKHCADLDRLFQPSPTVGTHQIQTDVDAFDRLRHVEGQATCAGCGRVAPKKDLCYSQALDAYYHRECLARDLSWSDPSRNPE